MEHIEPLKVTVHGLIAWDNFNSKLNPMTVNLFITKFLAPRWDIILFEIHEGPMGCNFVLN
jgi:hypothetical protein